MKKIFINEAISLAADSIHNEGGPFGAIIVKNGTIVGRGTNAVTRNNDPTAHAEVQAIRNACQNINAFQLSGCELYTSSEPCPMCLAAIYWARIPRVYYANTCHDARSIGFDDQYIYTELALPHSDKAISVERITDPGILSKALSVFHAWNNLLSKKKY